MNLHTDHIIAPGRPPLRHLVQFYGAEAGELIRALTRYVSEGLAAGSAVLIVATADHTDALLGALAEPADGRDRSRAIVCLDAQATLDRFMVNGQPDWRRFEQTVGGIVRGLRRSAPAGTLRVYGEMVGLLWQAGQGEAAVCLENFWNVLLGDDEFALFCGYPIDVFSEEFTAAEELLRTHSHVLYGAEDDRMARALDAATRDVLGAQVASLSERMSVEGAVASHVAEDIFRRARSYYRECA
ncbi:MAG: MEDS domain-containing protein [Candidatus Eremiobacteraeota bacterium]|nr:MEDS domain-containing protein [Candidatus Eremiobacteraeota bacterium]